MSLVLLVCRSFQLCQQLGHLCIVPRVMDCSRRRKKAKSCNHSIFSRVSFVTGSVTASAARRSSFAFCHYGMLQDEPNVDSPSQATKVGIPRIS